MRRTTRSAQRTVLAYHAVGRCPNGGRVHRCVCTAPAVFAQQMAYLARRREVVSLDDLVAGRGRGGKPAVAITFDDGYRNVLTTALPVLRRHGFPATVFVPTRWIGDRNHWDASTDCFPLDLLDEDELRFLDEQGIAIESHGHDHLDLEAADPPAVAADLEASYARLAEVLGRQPRHVAYPYGHHTPLVHEAAEAAGFGHGHLFDGVEAGRYAHERVSVDGHEGRVRFALKTRGGYLARRHSWPGRAAAAIVRAGVPRPEGRRR